MSEDWASYFRRLRLEREAQAVEDTHATPLQITTPGHEVDLTTLPREPKAISNKLLDSGYAVKSCKSETFQEGAVYLSGEKKGERRPDKSVVWYSVQAVRGNRSAWINYCGNSFNNATVKDEEGLHNIELKREFIAWLNSD